MVDRKIQLDQQKTITIPSIESFIPPFNLMSHNHSTAMTKITNSNNNNNASTISTIRSTGATATNTILDNIYTTTNTTVNTTANTNTATNTDELEQQFSYIDTSDENDLLSIIRGLSQGAGVAKGNNFRGRQALHFKNVADVIGEY